MAFTFATYQSATGCTKYGPAGAEALLTYLEERFPWQRSMGICNCRAIAGTSSYSHHAECRAYDMGIPVTSDGQARPELGMQAVNLLGPHGARLGIDNMIYNRRIWSAANPAGRYYSGVHPHYDHIHIGLTRAAGRNLTYATLVSVLGNTGGSTLYTELNIGDKGEQVTALQVMLRSAGFGATLGGIDGDYGPKTSAALLEARQSVGSKATSGDKFSIDAWEQLHRAHALYWAKTVAGKEGPQGPPGKDGKDGVDGKDGEPVTLTIRSDVQLP